MQGLAGFKATYIFPIFGVEGLVVSFPDPPEMWKRGWDGSVYCGMLDILMIPESSVASRAFC